MSEYTFGRREAPDERDRRFPMRLMLDPMREQFFPRGLPDGSRHYFSGPILAQGETGTCVAHGWAAKVHAAPIMQPLPMSPFDFYRKIVAIDEWSDNDFESTAADHMLQSGTSVRAGAKALVDLGLGSNYLWAESAEDVRAWILGGFGGVVIGINWRTDMLRTDSEGFISYTGRNEGGHCVYLNGWNDRVKRGGKVVKATRGPNSWGNGWGQGGRFWMTMDDLDRAIGDHGEACALTEIRVARRT
jgi:hypothetical protein